MKRYFVEAIGSAERVELPPDESHHAIHVMRAKPGQPVVLFDGTGTEAVGKIAEISKKSVQVQIESRRRVEDPFPCRVTLATAVPKQDRFTTLLEKSVELGVAAIQPMTTARSVAEGPRPGSEREKRCGRILVSAMKQCGRSGTVPLHPSKSLREILMQADRFDRVMLLSLSEEAQSIDRVIDRLPGSMLTFIGPEGGFTEEEIGEIRKAGGVEVKLAPTVLRIETAALAFLAQVFGVSS